MAPAFLKSEYDDRLARVRTEMAARGLDALVIGDPDNINWLTGYDAWSFYTPQMMLVDLHDGPFWMGRLMDAGAANFTTYLTARRSFPIPKSWCSVPTRTRCPILPDGWRIMGSPRPGSAMRATATISRRARWTACDPAFRGRNLSMPTCW